MNLQLAGWLDPFDEQEVKEAVFSCDGCKAPDPDGYTLKLFQQCWNIIKQDLMLDFNEF